MGVPAAVFGVVERCVGVGVAGGELPSAERAGERAISGLSRAAAPKGLGSGLETTLISTSASEEDMALIYFLVYWQLNLACS